jgi:hypothetical protein
MYRDTKITRAHRDGKNYAIPGLYRDSFSGLSGQFLGRLLPQVTFTNTTAVPLGGIY